MSRLHKILLFVLTLLFFGAYGSTFLQTANADAWQGRNPFEGYFSGVNSPSYCTGYTPARCGDENSVLPPGVINCGPDTRALPTQCSNSVKELIDILRNYNRNGSSGSRERASSAFIFWTLLGHDAAYANAHGGRSIPANYTIPNVPGSGFDALENLINEELADGQISINWTANPTLFPRTYSEYNANTKLADVAQDTQDGPQTGEAIEFKNNKTGKVIYSLFRECANPGGTLDGLPQLDSWKLTGTSSVNVPTAKRGQTVVFTHTVHNEGPLKADFSRRLEKSTPTNNNYQNLTGLTADSLNSGATRTVTNNVTIPMNAQNGDVICERIYFTNANGPGSAADTSNGACVKVFVPATCGNVSTLPTLVQPGESFTATYNLNLPGGPPPYTALHVTSVGYSSNNANPLSLTPPGNPDNMAFTTPPRNAPAAGTYSVSWQLFNGGTAVSQLCNGKIIVTDLPYFDITTGDIEAGGDFQSPGGGSCINPPGDGVIGSWYDGATAHAGAHTLFAAIALGQITGFASAQNRTSGVNQRPTGLSFANFGPGAGTINANDADSPKLGGKYHSNNCFFTPQEPATQGVPGTVTVGGNLSDGAYAHTGNVTLNSGAVAVGHNVALYVKNGDVHITGAGITLGTNGGVWNLSGNITNVPSFLLDVVGGNIYIDPSVGNLDGIYISQQSGGQGGTIYTCATAGGAVAAANMYANCRSRLNIHGAFIGDQVNLMRTLGTLDEGTKTGVVCTNGAGATNDCASEEFDFSPEIYLSNPAVAPPNNGAPQYDAITSLPPVL